MGIIKKAQGDQPVITPDFFKLLHRSVAESVVLFFDPDILARFAREQGYGKPSKIGRLSYHEPPEKGRPAFAGPAMGAPMAAIAMEALAVLGAKNILGFGVCGSLVPELSIGDIFLPDSAICEEGVSSHYAPGKERFAPSLQILESIRQQLAEAGCDFQSGPVWTTDALFREGADKVTEYAGQGVMAVDMETSALCAVADSLNVQYAVLMVISDELSTLRWNPGFKRPRFKKSLTCALNHLSVLRF